MPDSDVKIGGSLELWDVASRQSRPQLLADDLRVPHCVTFSPDGKRLAMIGGGEYFDDLVASRYKTDQYVRRCSFSGDIILWEVATGRKLLRRPLGKTCPTLIRISPDGRRLLTMEILDEENWGSSIRLWDVERMLKAEQSSPSRPRL
jgi:WD40 repeat protein